MKMHKAKQQPFAEHKVKVLDTTASIDRIMKNYVTRRS